MTGAENMKNMIDKTAAANMADANRKLVLYFNIFCTIVDYSRDPSTPSAFRRKSLRITISNSKLLIAGFFCDKG